MTPDSKPISLQDRFRGCLLGLAIGDALGGLFEGQSAEHLRRRFPTTAALMDYPQEELWYTDDTQMTIGVAESLATGGEILEDDLCGSFVANYVPSRGYGRGARVVLEAMAEGRDYRQVAAEHFPGGSFGNGAAMRVAPVGLLFHDDPDGLWEQARLSALPTHVHPLGIEGAQLLAVGVALAVRSAALDRDAFFSALLQVQPTPVYREKLELARRLTSAAELAQLGNGIQAAESVPTALASFALTPYSYPETVGNVILLGGDTDTMAAMGGALSGAFLGWQAIPQRLLHLLEDKGKGQTYLIELADRLWMLHRKVNEIR